MGTNVGTTVTPWLLSLGGLEGGGALGRLLRPAGFVPLLSLWGIAAYLAGKGSPPGHRPGPAGLCRSDAGHGDHDRRCIGPGPGGGVPAAVHGLRQPPAGGAGRGGADGGDPVQLRLGGDIAGPGRQRTGDGGGRHPHRHGPEHRHLRDGDAVLRGGQPQRPAGGAGASAVQPGRGGYLAGGVLAGEGAGRLRPFWTGP